MPFTFAHPAIILPLTRVKVLRQCSVAMVVGSLAPDFESFFLFGAEKVYSHHWSNLLWFDLPMSVILLALWLGLFSDALVVNLPVALKERFSATVSVSSIQTLYKKPLIYLTGLLIGLLSHLLWDAFTHLNLSYPDSIKSRIMLGNRRLFIVLQYVCSILGMAYICYFIYRMPRKAVQMPAHNVGYFWIALLVCFVAITVSVLFIRYPTVNLRDTKYDISLCISGFFYALLLVSIVYRVNFKKRF